jgi:hypothetical protein
MGSVVPTEASRHNCKAEEADSSIGDTACKWRTIDSSIVCSAYIET